MFLAGDMMKGIYIVLTGGKKTIEENEKKIREYLDTFKRKIGNNEVRCATIQREIPIDKEGPTGTHFRLQEMPLKIQEYLKSYRAVILKYHQKGNRGQVYTRGRRWRFKKGKTQYKYGGKWIDDVKRE